MWVELKQTLAGVENEYHRMTMASEDQGLGKLNLLGVAVDPKPPLAELNGFLLAASWLGFPPRPLKKPPPLVAFPDPNRPPLEVDDC